MSQSIIKNCSSSRESIIGLDLAHAYSHTVVVSGRVVVVTLHTVVNYRRVNTNALYSIPDFGWKMRKKSYNRGKHWESGRECRDRLCYENTGSRFRVDSSSGVQQPNASTIIMRVAIIFLPEQLFYLFLGHYFVWTQQLYLNLYYVLPEPLHQDLIRHLICPK